jgi:hypothetical protein
MNTQAAAANQKSLLEEYAAELTPAPGELAATLGPAQRRPLGGTEPRRAPEEAPA